MSTQGETMNRHSVYPRFTPPSPVPEPTMPRPSDLVHPEDTCDDCNGPNFVWWAAGDRWLVATGEPNGPILCPGCFVKRWEAATGFTCMWKLEPDDRTIRAHDACNAERGGFWLSAEQADALAEWSQANTSSLFDGAYEVACEVARARDPEAAKFCRRDPLCEREDEHSGPCDADDGLVPCNVRLAHNTIGRLHAVRLASGASNMADALSLAIRIASEVMHAQSKGAKVMLVNGDDQRELVVG